MFIRKVGYLLLVRLKLFRVAAKISPFAMIASLFMIFLTTHLKQQYKFQQPSLRTKIYDVQQKYSLRELKYIEVMPGIKYLWLQGLLQNQCILITFPQINSQDKHIKGIYQTLKNHQHLSKNIVFLTYRDIQTLNMFFQWYSNLNQNLQFSFGIIRAGLNIQIEDENRIKYTEKDDKTVRKDKAYFKIYTSSLHPDLDYFQSIKQLMQKLQIIWSPCQQIHKSKFLPTIKKNLLLLDEYLNRQTQLRLFIDHALCEFNEHLSFRISPHKIMMDQGFQAATIKFIVSSNQNKIQKQSVCYEDLQCLLQSNLACNRIICIQLTLFTTLLLALILCLCFMFYTLVCFFSQQSLITQDHKSQLSIRIQFILISYMALTEYYLTNNYSLTLAICSLIFIVSIFYQLIKVRNIIKSENLYRNYYQISLISIQGLISIYFGVFCFSLSILTILLTILMIIKPKNLIKKLAVKLILFLVFCYFYWSKDVQSIEKLLIDFSQISAALKICLILPLVHYSF